MGLLDGIFGGGGSKKSTSVTTTTNTSSSTRVGSIGYSGANTVKIFNSIGKTLSEAHRINAQTLLAAGNKSQPMDTSQIITLLGIGLAIYQLTKR